MARKTIDPKTLKLDELANGCPAITSSLGGAMSEASSVCMELQGHVCGVILKVAGIEKRSFAIEWPQVTAQMRSTWKDENEAIEFGATGISCLIVREMTEFTFIERAVKGTGFDYWLGKDANDLFQNKARLEISGILEGAKKIEGRVRRKIKQTGQSESTNLPAYVSVIEFGTPAARLVKK